MNRSFISVIAFEVGSVLTAPQRATIREAERHREITAEETR